MNNKNNFPPSAWVVLIEDIMGERLFDVPEDSIDVAWQGLPALLDTLEERQADVLYFRYAEQMTYKAIALIMPRRDKSSRRGLTSDRVRQIQYQALCRLRYPTRLRILKSCIVGDSLRWPAWFAKI